MLIINILNLTSCEICCVDLVPLFLSNFEEQRKVQALLPGNLFILQMLSGLRKYLCRKFMFYCIAVACDLARLESIYYAEHNMEIIVSQKHLSITLD